MKRLVVNKAVIPLCCLLLVAADTQTLSAQARGGQERGRPSVEERLFEEDLSFSDDDEPEERLFDQEPLAEDAETPVPSEPPTIPPGGEFREGGMVESPYVEELPPPARTATNGLPVYPGDSGLPPRDRVALRFVTEGERELQQDNLDPARDRFEAAVELAPFQPYGYYFLGRVAFARGDHRQALAFLQKAEVLLARGDPAWLGETVSVKGAVYEDMGEYDRARAAYQHCLELAPQNLRALSAVARLGGD